jgi:hypothetical protein
MDTPNSEASSFWVLASLARILANSVLVKGHFLGKVKKTLFFIPHCGIKKSMGWAGAT